MERIHTAWRDYIDINGQAHKVEYCLFNADGYYGVSVEDKSGYGDRIWNLTTQKDRAEEIYFLLVEHLVTPISLRDVLEDML